MTEEYFEAHWRPLGAQEIPSTKLAEARRFLAPAIDMVAAREGVKWLDVGCGDGVHLTVLRARSKNDGLAGVDASPSAVARARVLLRGADADVRQGDALDLQAAAFETFGHFDVVFSYGVLAYTGDWRRGLAEMARACKPGGLVGFWIMAPPQGAVGRMMHGVRRMTSRLPAWGKRAVANLIVPFLVALPTRSGVTPLNASWRACVEIVMVNIAPETLDFPTRAEIVETLDRLDLSPVYEDENAPHAFWRRKAGAAAG